MANNNDNSGVASAVGLVAACFGIFFLLIFAIFAFFSFVFTVLALIALVHPVKIGSLELTSSEAKDYLKRGIIGAVLILAFAVFCELAFGIRINGEYLPHILAGGYSIGSLGMELMWAVENDPTAAIDHQAHSPLMILPPDHTHQASFKEEQPPAPRKPFEFASWDDEEELRK